jgi:hypothetical protein
MLMTVHQAVAFFNLHPGWMIVVLWLFLLNVCVWIEFLRLGRNR